MYGFRLALGTARGLRILLSSMFAAFGLASAIVQFVGQLFPRFIHHPDLITLITLGCCLVFGAVAAYPRHSITKRFTHPETTVGVHVGDIFEQDGSIVIGFVDTFDTVSRRNRVIHDQSLQGQLVRHRYDGDRRRLDRDLASALRGLEPIAVEHRRNKSAGRLRRYPVGTVAIIRHPKQLIFAVAYSEIDNHYVARSSVDHIWKSLNSLWDAVCEAAHQDVVCMPIIGSGLARTDHLNRENLLKMILLSFAARSRHAAVCRELRIIVHADDLGSINMLEVRAFLNAL